MSIGWLFNSTVSAILLPPFNLALLCALGLALRRRWPRGGMLLSVASLLLLVLLSTRMGATLLIAPLEAWNPPLQSTQVTDKSAQAIVVLGGGRIADAPEYGGEDILSAATLLRASYAARLQRETGLPILASGGRPDGSQESEAAIIARTLREFSVPVKWLEEESDNTAENAQFSARMLRAEGVTRILLVTDALHMQRAKRIFRETGLDVVAAPTVFYTAARWAPDDFLPKAVWLQRSSYAMHEWIGLVWYQLRHRNVVLDVTH